MPAIAAKNDSITRYRNSIEEDRSIVAEHACFNAEQVVSAGRNRGRSFSAGSPCESTWSLCRAGS